MTKLSNETLLHYGFKHISKKKYREAIKIFYRIIKNNPSDNVKMKAYIGLGDAVRAEYEIELAEKIYKKALIMAENFEDTKMIKFIDNKIENIYVFKKEREINPIQIEFFMRAIMKLLSFLGKTDWI
ncbi:MAG: tetratricopeptide repeat protein [Candidatus Helarchaeota archaeon]